MDAVSDTYSALLAMQTQSAVRLLTALMVITQSTLWIVFSTNLLRELLFLSLYVCTFYTLLHQLFLNWLQKQASVSKKN